MTSGFAELTQQAHALVAAGDLTGARDLLGTALRDVDPGADDAPPEVADAAGLQARVLVTLGDAAAARTWATFAYSAAARRYGPTDQRTVATAATLAAVLHRVGSHAPAADLYRDVIIELTATDGPESLRVLAAHADLATVEYAQGECAVARSRLQDAWELHREVYGDGHPAGIRMLARLGTMERDCGLHTSAHERLALARELCRQHLPADHPLAAQIGALAAAGADPGHACTDPATAAATGSPIPQARTGTPPADPARTRPAYAEPHRVEPSTDRRPGEWGDPAPRYPEPGYPPTVPPPRLPPAPPVDPPPRWSAPAAPDADREPRPGVPPPRSAPDWRPTEFGTVPAGRYGDDPDLDPEPDRWPPEQVTPVTPDPADNVIGPVPRPRPVPPLPPAVPEFAGDEYPEQRWHDGGPPRLPAGDPDEADGVRRVRHLPERRSARLPARIPRPARPVWRRPPVIVGGLVLLVLAGTTAVAIGFGSTDGGSDPPPDTPSTGTGAAISTPASAPPASPGSPPGDLTLVDDRTSVTLTWTYPAGAEGSVVLAGGRAGQEPRAFQELPAGSTGYVVYSLDVRTNYCFTVAVVYSADVVGRADPVCTDRPGAAPAR
ncbi:tetratricopeptide repeat protein [Plantactinospora sp. B5E13]|uniref:tetratricopeptide repeat protein n=1 Tax=Plantactinospora sp. B5E13 TaxID=3153758 RepID=UPI00325D9F17